MVSGRGQAHTPHTQTHAHLAVDARHRERPRVAGHGEQAEALVGNGIATACRVVVQPDDLPARPHVHTSISPSHNVSGPHTQ